MEKLWEISESDSVGIDRNRERVLVKLSCRNFSRSSSDDVEGTGVGAYKELLFCSQCSTNNEIRQRVLVRE